MKKVFILISIVAASFLLGSFLGVTVDAERNSQKDVRLVAANIPEVSRPAPDFALKDTSGKKISLSSYKGRVIMINFWATWCPPCRQEMPSMEALFKEYNKRGFEVLAISSDSQGEKIVKPFMEFYELTFSALMDADGEVHSLYGVTSIPTTYIVDKNGNIVQKIMGPRDWKDKNTKGMIEKLLQ
ncbi:MAG: TlpA family protein disulfide reductase [Nitrospirae bacterium]|nr:TlpA family protein disulfide reductase [Nitrospirota bacterium]